MTPKEYEFINGKYGNLIYKIAHQITGDTGTCSLEDNIQDLWVAAYNALEGYNKQGDGQNGTFGQFKDTEGFNKYIKTVLWNLKNTKGKKATKHRNQFMNAVCVHNHKDTIEDTSADHISEWSSSSLPVRLTQEEKDVLKVILDNPNTVKPSGGIDCTKVSKHLGVYWKKVKRIVTNIQIKMENSL